jgi:hypothetical protein
METDDYKQVKEFTVKQTAANFVSFLCGSAEWSMYQVVSCDLQTKEEYKSQAHTIPTTATDAIPAEYSTVFHV